MKHEHDTGKAPQSSATHQTPFTNFQKSDGFDIASTNEFRNRQIVSSREFREPSNQLVGHQEVPKLISGSAETGHPLNVSSKDISRAFVEDKKCLGSGGFGQVYKSYDIIEDRNVAVKRVSFFSAFSGPADLAKHRAIREVKVHAKLHEFKVPGIVGYIGYSVRLDVETIRQNPLLHRVYLGTTSAQLMDVPGPNPSAAAPTPTHSTYPAPSVRLVMSTPPRSGATPTSTATTVPQLSTIHSSPHYSSHAAHGDPTSRMEPPGPGGDSPFSQTIDGLRNFHIQGGSQVARVEQIIDTPTTSAFPEDDSVPVQSTLQVNAQPMIWHPSSCDTSLHGSELDTASSFISVNSTPQSDFHMDSFEWALHKQQGSFTSSVGAYTPARATADSFGVEASESCPMEAARSALLKEMGLTGKDALACSPDSYNHQTPLSRSYSDFRSWNKASRTRPAFTPSLSSSPLTTTTSRSRPLAGPLAGPAPPRVGRSPAPHHHDPLQTPPSTGTTASANGAHHFLPTPSSSPFREATKPAEPRLSGSMPRANSAHVDLFRDDRPAALGPEVPPASMDVGLRSPSPTPWFLDSPPRERAGNSVSNTACLTKTCADAHIKLPGIENDAGAATDNAILVCRKEFSQSSTDYDGEGSDSEDNSHATRHVDGEGGEEEDIGIDPIFDMPRVETPDLVEEPKQRPQKKKVRWPFVLEIKMEFANAGTLEAWIARRNKQVLSQEDHTKAPHPDDHASSSSSPAPPSTSPPYEVGETEMNIFRQLVTSLAWIHQNGYIHRDIKPANILLHCPACCPGVCQHLLSDGPPSHLEVKICDFGHAVSLRERSMEPDNKRPLSSGAKSHQRKDGTLTQNTGTASYIAPEQATTNSYSHPADMFPLGLVLLELCHPVGLGHERAVLFKAAKAGKLPTAFTARLPFQASLVQRLLQHNAHDRPTAAQLLEELHPLPQPELPAHPSAPPSLSRQSAFATGSYEGSLLSHFPASLQARMSPAGPDSAGLQRAASAQPAPGSLDAWIPGSPPTHPDPTITQGPPVGQLQYHMSECLLPAHADSLDGPLKRTYSDGMMSSLEREPIGHCPAFLSPQRVAQTRVSARELSHENAALRAKVAELEAKLMAMKNKKKKKRKRRKRSSVEEACIAAHADAEEEGEEEDCEGEETEEPSISLLCT